MKYKISKKRVEDEFNPDGSARFDVTRTLVLPADRQVFHQRGLIGAALVFTVVSLSWSTWSIGELLGGGIGYLAAGLFDLVWVVALWAAYLARYDENKRALPERVGWVLLAVTMGAIFWHGLDRNDIPLAVVGALVSGVTKVVWVMVMNQINAKLTDEDKAKLARKMSKAQSRAAEVQVDRTVARIEHDAELERMAMERERIEMMQVYGLRDTIEVEPTANVPVIENPPIGRLNKTEAVRYVMEKRPNSTPEKIESILREFRDDIDLKYIRTVISRTEPESEATVYELHQK